MSDPLNSDAKVELDRALDDVESLAAYAYAHGYHELGYDAIKAVRDGVKQLREYEWMYKELQS